MKKKLGITDTKNIQNYIDWFNDADKGSDIEVIKLGIGSKDYQQCSGIVLSGGIDVHPDLYDGDQDYPNGGEWDEDRDQFEEEVYRFAKKSKIPLLAICRGLQLVNVVEGGTLIQDLGEGNETHKKEGTTDKEHKIDIDSRTFLGEITGSMGGVVNSAHHQAIDPEGVGRELLPSAFARDGVIEALEYKSKQNKGFMVAVQWHPERMNDREQSSLSKDLKKALLTAVRAF